MYKTTQTKVKRPNRPPKLVSAPGSLDKLAHQVTSSSGTAGEDDVRLTKNAKYSDKQNFGKRARVKYLSQAMAVGLANVPSSRLTKSYWNTYYCSSVLQKKGDNLTGKFCKNRFCLVCCRIRSMQLFKQFASVLDSWPEKHLVTLTLPNCAADDLASTIRQMKEGFDTIRRRFAMQHRRRQRAAPLQALRKLECTNNPDRNDYHPHFHLVVPDLATANELRTSWLEQFPSAKWKAQDVRPADSGAANELFKYFTKLITTQSKERFIRLGPLNVIFEAISGQRTFQAFGIPKTAPVEDDLELDALAESIADSDVDALFEWDQEQADWIDKDTGELLTNYKPSDQFRAFVETKIVYNSAHKFSSSSPHQNHEHQIQQAQT
jgi:plasmid rolling circle replication initiator protein Rep